MPNKKRRSRNAPALDFELPPTTLAKTSNLSSTKSRLRAKRNRRSTNTFEAQDDTPKAFTRLLAFAAGTRRLPKGPDNGRPAPPSSKKRKTAAAAAAAADTKAAAAGEAKEHKMQHAAQQLTIQPGESLREFNRRVDASLPVDLKVAREPRKPKAKKPAAPASASASTPGEGEGEGGDGGGDYRDHSDGDGGGRKRGRRAASPDPWAVLAAKRAAPRFGDVAGAPPSLARPREVLHSRGIVGVDVEGVPRSAGSRARREGLAVERRGVVEAYRRLVQGRRGEEV